MQQQREELQIDKGERIKSTHPDKQNIEEKGRLLVQTEPDVSNGNLILKKRLRAPRYFEPQQCERRGEISYKRKTPKYRKKWKICYICGTMGHKGKICKQVKGCFICNRKGHLAMDCPNKNAGTDCASLLCLACGNSGHDMFSCTNDYDSEDLKAVECYVCRKVGHLCCVDKRTERPTKATCYNCGETGHFGSDCPNSNDGCHNLSNSGQSGHSQQPCIEGSVKKADADKDEAGAQPAKRQKTRRGSKRRKNKPSPTVMNPRWRPPIVGPYYGRPGANVWLSPQAVAATNHQQQINHHTGTQVINPSHPPIQLSHPSWDSQSGSQIPQLSLNQENELVVNVHGYEAVIPAVSYPMVRPPHLLSNSQNRTQLPQHPNLQFPVTTAQIPPPLNHQTGILLPHQVINPQPVAIVPHLNSNSQAGNSTSS